jgi:rubredoxin
LLECPKCGLLEDVTIEGELITCVPSAEEQDTGLRFEETSPGRFRCPACGSIFHAD